MRGCELKLLLQGANVIIRGVTTRAVMWIEIEWQPCPPLPRCVTTHVVVWIEIRQGRQHRRSRFVTTHAVV